jgi:hypothetical protein
MRVLDILEGEMTERQMGVIIGLYMLALAILGGVAVVVIHVLKWQW